MEFLAPLMLLGALGAGIPIVVHLLGRRKAKRVRFAALDFLLGSDKKVARKLRLRELLLLLLRVLVCLAIPLVLAKPYAACQATGPEVGRGPQAAVFVIDNSVTAMATSGDTTMLDAELSAAHRVLRQLGPEAEVAILTTARLGAPSVELSRDHLGLHEVISGIVPTYHSADIDGALRQAGELLTGSSHSAKTVFLFAVPTRSNVARELPWAGGDIGLRLLDPSEGAALDNLAITELEVRSDGSTGSRGVLVTVEVQNFGSQPKSGVEVRLRLGDKVVARGTVDLPVNGRATKRFSANLTEAPRSAEISAEISGDSQPADDRRYIVVDAHDQVPVLLVNGDPHSVRHEDELYYLEAALRPGDRSDSGTQYVVSSPEGLAEIDLAQFDVIVLANVHSLDGRDRDRLVDWVEAGGGLLVSMGDKIDPDHYNKELTRLLPQLLQSRVELGHGREGKDRQSSALRLSKIESEHPIFAVFPADTPGLSEASFQQIMLLGPTTNVSDRRVLARYDNGAVALVEARHGSGLLLLLTSTIDRDWNDLPIHPSFLPLVQQMVRYLAAKPYKRLVSQVQVGDAVLVKVGPHDAKLEVEDPGDNRSVFEGERIEKRKNARVTATDTPGFYRVHAVDDLGARSMRPESAFAVNVDVSAADLRPTPTAHLEQSAATSAAAGSGQHKRRVELWHGIAAALLLLLLLEAATGWGQTGSRQAPRP